MLLWVLPVAAVWQPVLPLPFRQQPLILQLIVLLQTYLSVHIHRAEIDAATGDFNKANRWHLYSGVLLFLARAIPCFIAVYIGNTVLSDFIEWLPEFYH